MKLQITPSTKQDKVKKQSFLHDDAGRTLEVIILTAIPVLIGIGAGVLIYNAVSDGTQNIQEVSSIVGAAAEDTAEDTNQTTSSTTTEAAEVTTTTEATTTDTSPTTTTTTTAENLEQGGFLPPGGFPGPTGFLYPGGFIPPEPETEKILSSFQVHKMSSKYQHACVILKDGTVECWGSNEYAQLGDGTTEIRYEAVVVMGIGEPNPAIEISASGDSSCAVLRDGTIKCWGNNEYGQLGNGETGGVSAPVQVVGINTAIQVSIGLDHACALLQAEHDSADIDAVALSTSVKCWGDGGSGELGNGLNENQSSPVIVRDLYYPIQISAGLSSTCALIGFVGVIQCWGNNYSGVLGDGTTTHSNFPNTYVRGIGIILLDSTSERAIQVAVGSSHACALMEYGSVRCWGYNGRGRLGDGSATDSLVSIEVSDTIDGTNISVGNQHTCVVLRDSTVKCWGTNSSGQLGDDTLINRLIPTAVTDISGVSEVFAGAEHTCALLITGEIKCWGNNAENQLTYN